jgi:hypothetical protein
MVHTFGLWLIGAVTAVAIVIGVVALFQALPWRMEWKKSTVPAATRWTSARKVLLAVCGVLAVVGVGLLSVSVVNAQQNVHSAGLAHNSHAQAPPVVIKFLDPEVTTQDPIPTVPCHMEVQAIGHLPNGDVLAIGNAIQGRSIVKFESNVTWIAPDTRQAYITFGQNSDAGQRFNLYAVVMPGPLEAYLLGETSFDANSARPYWNAPGLPPAPAVIAGQEIVMRSQAKNAC